MSKQATAKQIKQEQVKSIGLNVINGGQPRPKQITVKDNSKTTNPIEIKAQREQALADAKVEIARCCHNIGANFYKMGQSLKQVRDRDLWKEGGAKNWTEFAKAVEGVTYATVCNLISVVENLDMATATRLGPSISYAVARAPGKECQDELIKMASQGATVKQVYQRAKIQRVETGTDVPARGNRKAKSADVPNAKPAKKGRPKDIRKDLESKASVEKHDAKVATIAKGECKLKKGKGAFVVDGIIVEVKLVGKTKLEFVARLD